MDGDDDAFRGVAAEQVLRQLGDALLTAAPAWWKQVRMRVSFAGEGPRIESPEGHAEPISVTPRMMLALGTLASVRDVQKLGWSGVVIEARCQPDGTWERSIDVAFPAPVTPAPEPPGPAALPASFPPTTPGLHPGSRMQVEELVRRAEGEVLAAQTREALGTLGAALAELPGDAFRWGEAGWLYLRMASIRLGRGDAAAARRSAESALRCAGWKRDPRALLRLGQALVALEDPGAALALGDAHRAGGHEWFASVAPELLAMIGK